MADKEQIIIDGKKYNKCEGCELYDGYMCNGARSYEPEGEAHRAICDKHIAQEFWKVYNQLARKTQECELLETQLESYHIGEPKLIQKNQELKHECEELKEKNKNLRCMYESMSELCGIKDEALIDKQADIDELSHHCFEYSDRIYCYRKVLKEIERYCSIKNDPDIQDVPYRIIAPVILDIINKAKGEGTKNE